MKKFSFTKGLVIGLLTLALCLTCFGVAKVSAAAPAAQSATYAPATDTITAASACQVFILKAEKDNKLKAGATGIDLEAGVPVALADLGIKSTTKDVFLYICAKTDIEDEGGVTVDANLVIKAQEAKKIVGQINYNKADDPNSDEVLSAIVTDAKGNTISNPTIYWWDGSEENAWADANSGATAFTGAKLAEMLETGGTIYIKQLGSPNQFSSKPVKVKIAKQAKAPKIKVDVKKDTIALKNGFDFGLATGDDGDYTFGTWFTILPTLKDASNKTLETSILSTATYTPLDKKANGAKAAYTRYKVKALPIDTVAEKLGKVDSTTHKTNVSFKLAVRKSATNKKPASAVQVIEIAPQVEAPLVFTQDLVKNEYLVGSVAAEDFDKKGFAIGDIKNYPGTKKDGGNDVLATSNYWKNFAVDENGTGKDEAAAAYEFCVIKSADLAEVDWTSVSWKKITPSKTKLSAKLNSTYTKVGSTTKIKASFKAIAKPNPFTASATVPTGANVLLIRRAGTKDGTRASQYATLYALKDGKNVEVYSTLDLGADAAKYTIQFATYKYDSTTTANSGWYVDSSIDKIVGYFTSTVTDVEIPALDSADYFKSTNVALDATAKIASVGTTANEGITNNKATVTFTNLTTDPVITYSIKQYANIKVNAVFGTYSTAFSKVSAIAAKELASVTDGKIGTATTVSAYVGDPVVIPFTGLTETGNDGYGLDTEARATTIDATGTGYFDGAYAADPKVTITPTKAEEITVDVQYTVAKKYTVKVAAGSASGVSIYDNTSAIHDQAVTFKVSATVPDGKALVVKNGSTTLSKNASDEYTVTIDGSAPKNIDITITIEDP